MPLRGPLHHQLGLIQPHPAHSSCNVSIASVLEYSLFNPEIYCSSNCILLISFVHKPEAPAYLSWKKLIYASSSSIFFYSSAIFEACGRTLKASRTSLSPSEAFLLISPLNTPGGGLCSEDEEIAPSAEGYGYAIVWIVD